MRFLNLFGKTKKTNNPPEDWADKDAWDRFFNAELLAGRTSRYPDFIVSRFLNFVHQKGGRVWFPGCGLDPYPRTYADQGCRVLATDFSSVAVKYQQRLADGFLADTASANSQGALVVAEHDFVLNPVDEKFDVVINSLAYQGLSPHGMITAARHFYTALRPGGACVIDTINVQGNRRNLIEDCLIAAGFFIPFQKAERWYREQLNATGIQYVMVLDHPRIPIGGQYPSNRFNEFAERDQKILDGLRAEYESRYKDEAAEVKERTEDPMTMVAHVVYATG